MTSLEKAINLGYLFLNFKPKKRKKKPINTCTNFFCMYLYVSIYSEECFWPQYMYPKLSPFNGYRWWPLGKLSHLGLEQLDTIVRMTELFLMEKYSTIGCRALLLYNIIDTIYVGTVNLSCLSLLLLLSI